MGLLSEQKTAHAISVNILYEIKADKISCRISLEKDSKVMYDFSFSGRNNDISAFVDGLSEEILKKIKG